MYSQYVKAVAGLAGGELQPAELTDLAAMVWSKLQPLTIPEEQQLQRQGALLAQTLKHHTAALQPLKPMLQHAQAGAQLAAVVGLVGKLKQWQQQIQQQQQLVGSSGGKATGTTAAAAATAAGKGGKGLGTLATEKEFGADLDFKLDAGVEQGWLAEVFTPSAPGVTGVTRVTTGSQGYGVTPGEMKEMFLEDTKQAGGGTTTATAAAAAGFFGGMGGLDDAVDIDSDDEKKGKGKKVRDRVLSLHVMICHSSRHRPHTSSGHR